MELTGKVELDEESMSTLKESIRQEVVDEINEKGLMWSEVKKYLESLSMPEYFNMVTKTLGNGVAAGKKQEDADDFHFDDEKKFRILKTMQELVNLSGIR